MPVRVSAAIWAPGRASRSVQIVCEFLRHTPCDILGLRLWLATGRQCRKQHRLARVLPAREGNLSSSLGQHCPQEEQREELKGENEQDLSSEIASRPSNCQPSKMGELTTQECPQSQVLLTNFIVLTVNSVVKF